MKVKRALVSVSDKTGLEKIIKVLDGMGVEILSTGGTAKFISGMGVHVKEVSGYTGFPEMMDGRVKTLHPAIHGGLLAVRDNKEHMRQMQERGLGLIDIVIVNLYPFEKTVAAEGVSLDQAIENIDIGGPSMLRSAAKNYRSVAVVSSPEQYDEVISELEDKGTVSDSTRKKLAVEVYRRTSEYDKAISSYLSGKSAEEKDLLPASIDLGLTKDMSLRYGENPHQEGAYYRCRSHGSKGISAIEKIQGKELSFNNIMDLGAAVEIVADFSEPAVSVIKHNNPCGAAAAGTIEEAYIDALDCDRLSAFGSIMGFNRPIDGAMAATILREAVFVECIIAPGYDEKALEAFSSKKNLRILKIPSVKDLLSSDRDFKKVPGGFLVQRADAGRVDASGLKVVTREKPSEETMKSLLFGWKLVKYVKSNAIVLSKGTKTVGIGAGQMSRVDSVIIAIRKAGERASGSVMASDAFFPMPDSIEEAHKAGVSAIIQPGGSIKDKDVIAACDMLGIPMVFTGTRHFRH
ncbi:MAG: bifunctional phosphoribosylaminoimidazolecarboxamide formyltransferase/IMP cyclohydrolase [Candidatus Omnitrophica bacterium]|nr:bifunctional phosphoribosylaminoimidazolecarboxamide formyltransferase/IMP cyclohydrolase [Candidatus Omnitrophota bacterium]